MPLYQIFDVIVDSDMVIPELPLAAAGAPDISISSGQTTGLDIAETRFFHEWKDEDGEPTLSCGRYQEDYVLSFPDGVDFLLSVSNGTVQYFPQPGLPIVTLRHMLLDQVLPRFLAHQGHLILHASAIQLSDGRGIVFSGPSGAGKSTLAASFFKQGARLLTDDCLLLRDFDSNVTGIASYQGLRLYEDSKLATMGETTKSEGMAHYSTKRRIQLADNEIDASIPHVPVAAVFILQEGEAGNIHISQVSSARAAMSLVAQLFVLDVMDTNIVENNLRAITRLIEGQLSLFHIHYPRDYSHLNQFRHRVLDVIGGRPVT